MDELKYFFLSLFIVVLLNLAEVLVGDSKLVTKVRLFSNAVARERQIWIVENSVTNLREEFWPELIST